MKDVRWILIILYIVFILTRTIIGREVHPDPIFQGLFWELQNRMWHDIILNILLFVPLGFLIGGWKGVVVGLAISCGIETIQYFARIGFCELDDILNNTIGSVVGATLNTIILRIRINENGT